jgi:hypothetical protein
VKRVALCCFIALAGCGSEEIATLGASDSCVDAPAPRSAVFLLDRGSTTQVARNARIDDFAVDGTTVYFAVKPDPATLESVIYEASLVGTADAVELVRVRNAERLAVTRTHLYFEEVSSSAQKTRLLFRVPRRMAPGVPEHITMPSEEAPSFVETGLRADGAGNVLGLRVFGGHYGIVRVAPDGKAERIDTETDRSMSGLFVVDGQDLFGISYDSVAGGERLLALSLATPRTPPRMLYESASPVIGIAADKDNLYVGREGAIEVLPKAGGVRRSIDIGEGVRPFHMAVGGGFLYGEFQRTPKNEASELGLARVPLHGGPLERIAEPNTSSSKVVVHGCSVIYSDNLGLHARPR